MPTDTRTLPDAPAHALAHAFEDEVFFNLRRQRNIFGWISLGCLLLAFFAVGALITVLPLKEIRPYVVMVDEATGQSELIVSVRPVNLAEEEAVREAELVRYVTRARDL